jgi:hypothetical protein
MSSYTDQLIRRTVAVFWGSLKDPAFLKQMKENRKIEELILMFVTTASAALRKDPSLAGDKWKIELNNQIAQFIRILRQCLANISYVPPELTARLDMYSAKLVPTSPSETSSDSGSFTAVARSETPNSIAVPAASNLLDMPLVQTVARLFGYSDTDVQNDLSSLKKICTEKASMVPRDQKYPLLTLTSLQAALNDLKVMTCWGRGRTWLISLHRPVSRISTRTHHFPDGGKTSTPRKHGNIGALRN